MSFAQYLVLAVVVVALFDWFVRLERRGDRHTIFVAYLVSVVAEALLGGASQRTPIGILRPQFAGQDFRLPDLVLVALVTARLLARPRGRLRIAAGVLPWAAFIAWYVTAFLIGRFAGENLSQGLFQAKFVFYLAGGMVAAAGADPLRLVRGLRIPAFVLAGAVVLNGVVDQTGLRLRFGTPLQSFDGLGRIGNDTVTMLTVAGVFVLLAEAVRPRRRVAVVLAGVILLAAPFSGAQRASYVVVAAVLLCLGPVILGATWKRRSSVRVLDLGLATGAVVFALSVATVFGVAGKSGGLLFDRFDAAFAGEAEVASAMNRIPLARAAIGEVGERPVFGWGLGHKVVAQLDRFAKPVEMAAHNVVLDLAVRSGLIGLVLFAVAVGRTLVLGARRWRGDPSRSAAALFLAANIGIVAVLAKAMVEPALELYRLTSVLGICIGLVLLAGRPAPSDDPAAPAPENRPEHRLRHRPQHQPQFRGGVS